MNLTNLYIKTLKELKVIVNELHEAIQQAFCKHSYVTQAKGRFDVLSNNNEKAGEVTLTMYTCSRCNKDRILVSDRTYIKPADRLRVKRHEEP